MARGKGADKRVGGLVVMVLGFLIFTVFGFAASTVSAADVKPIELKWANFQTKEADSIPPLMDWLKAIEARSKGALKAKMYFVGEIAETKDLLSLCRTGSIQVISTPPVYYTGTFPLNSVLQQYYPLNNTVEQAVYTWRGLRELPEVQAEFAKQNMYCLNRSSLGVYNLVSKKQVRNLADLKGMKLRIIGGDYPAEIVKAAGAVPVFQAVQDMYEGLMRGVTDGILLGVPAIDAYRLTEIGKFIGFPIGSVLGWANCINLDVWNKLTPELKEILQQTATEWGARDLQFLLDNEIRITKKMKDQGIQFPEFDKKDWQGIVERAGNPYEHCQKYLVTQGKVDPAVAEKFIKRWRELNEEYEKNYLTAGKKWQYK
jgi:TRAP-type C4-dicarboxylate transport system substrate-binding protein